MSAKTKHSLPCIKCGSPTRVSYVRQRSDGTLRKRACTSCGREFLSIERPLGADSSIGVTLEATDVRTLIQLVRQQLPVAKPSVNIQPEGK